MLTGNVPSVLSGVPAGRYGIPFPPIDVYKRQVGTWGMQAGAAQQPWGAWGYAAAGLRNRVSDPLHALAGWVMDDNHRGSWPEVSTEAVPAYFSAPAGLYVAAVVEALFGLEMHAPDGYIRCV